MVIKWADLERRCELTSSQSSGDVWCPGCWDSLWHVGQRFPLTENLLNVMSKSVMIWKTGGEIWFSPGGNKPTTNKKTRRRSKILITNDCHHKRALSDHVPAAWRLRPWWGCRWSAPPAPGPSCGPWSSRTEASGRRHSRRKVQSVSQWVSPAGTVSDCRGRSRTESSSTLYGSHSVFLCFCSVNKCNSRCWVTQSTLGRGPETADVWNVRLLCNWPHSLSPTRRNTTYDFFFSSGVDNMKI